MVGDQEVGSIESPLRVLDPVTSRQPSQKIKVKDGAFYVDGKQVFLHGTNYWPRYAPNGGYAEYDPVRVEADLTMMESLNFNLVNIRANMFDPRGLIDFLERCRNHGIWVRLEMETTRGNNAFRGTVQPAVISQILNSSVLPGNDRIFAYEILWEPYIGTHDRGYGNYVGDTPFSNGRTGLDGEWRAWVDERYGSLENAKQIWGVDPPLGDNGQLTNPSDDQLANDGPWRIMVDAYRRFTDDYLGHNIGEIVREIRRTDPDTLITYRNWSTMSTYGNTDMTYDLGTAAAHLDFFSPESYDHASWPDLRKWGFATAYSRYRTGGKPVQWVEFGYDIGADGGLAERAAQGCLLR